MTEKHRLVNNVLWRVLAGRIRRGRWPDAARGPPVDSTLYCCVNGFIQLAYFGWYTIAVSSFKISLHHLRAIVYECLNSLYVKMILVSLCTLCVF